MDTRGSRVSASEADAMSREVAAHVRAKFLKHMQGLIRSQKLPDIGLRQLDDIAGFVEGRTVEEVFPFLNGAVLPSWMNPVESGEPK